MRGAGIQRTSEAATTLGEAGGSEFGGLGQRQVWGGGQRAGAKCYNRETAEMSEKTGERMRRAARFGGGFSAKRPCPLSRVACPRTLLVLAWPSLYRWRPTNIDLVPS
jgi:hypothetical protein